jgi:hypothetical protein
MGGESAGLRRLSSRSFGSRRNLTLQLRAAVWPQLQSAAYPFILHPCWSRQSLTPELRAGIEVVLP